MTCQYIVVKYGDLFRGEYLNIGVFAYDMDPNVTEVKSKFLSNLSRIKSTFGYSDPIMEAILEGHLKKISTKEELNKAIEDANSPYTSLMYTLPRASLDSDVDRLLNDVAKIFLVE